MISIPNSADVIYHDSSDFLDMFKRGWTYPDRPLVLNQYVSYKILNAESPANFNIMIHDSISKLIQESVNSALEKYKDCVESFGCNPFPLELLQENMPVVVLREKNFIRAEVNMIDNDKKTLNVTLIDCGEEVWVSGQDVYPPSTDLLRYPKLAIRCALSQVIPLGTQWPDINYVEILQGESSSLVCPVVYSRGILEVYLVCDQKDVGICMTMTLGLADFVPLQHYFDHSKFHMEKYPKYDFTEWLGLNIPIFGIKMINYREAILQLNPLQVNEMLDVMMNHIKGIPKVAENFLKEQGDPCIVESKSGECFRATIIGVRPGKCLVKLVDYWNFQLVNDDQLRKIPDELVAVPEGATICVLADFCFHPDKKEIIESRLRNILEHKDLFCRIEAVDSRVVETAQPFKPAVSLSQVREDGGETPLWKLFDLPKPPLRLSLVYNHQFLNSAVGACLFSGLSDYFSDKIYHGVLSYVENFQSIWLQLNHDDRKADILTQEITNFYTFWKECPKLTSEMAVIGSYVVAQRSDDTNWYRAKVVQAYPEQDLYHVVFLDYGNHDFIPLSSMKSMINYFGKFKCLALQVALPIALHPNVDLIYLSKYITDFCESAGDTLHVWLCHQNDFNYAWIMGKKEKLLLNGVRLPNEENYTDFRSKNTSLAHTLLNSNLASGFLFQHTENIFE